jgi:hypothetical protein
MKQQRVQTHAVVALSRKMAMLVIQWKQARRIAGGGAMGMMI